MPSYARGDKVTFTGNVTAELLGMVGIVLRRRVSQGHYVYDIKISAQPHIKIPGLNLSAEGIIRNIPGDWIDFVNW